ncbi:MULTISPECIES: 5-dehydro-4-deoxyglucarate dehydratase [unclassified Streptomyces]|uniref:5-dehydro-4-deoxyglucarate dehydratase n=1 Tax=unclassified Streptomyces TaxID=2593676 RepID=UPI002257C2E9|nr:MULTISPECIES: 5-dehydro-4-deoxyglucarate dehydratase [unclassified Streptomyces]WSP59394.1 5-dehydro-4-deoxyglucarate dehydratase [Streptomyces sp. NBC_01241]WSU20088.1 5-dehydro-4-deoxyglucarate dehydratase [Streptomyces sp. NBC_01108]MCX4791157.1 5-dehydro-4-deoxyglucarate dehydratase [Streptomyces sp. NBC_01221]MCX4793125.1 5-dehydro-4-deoxyglucarate dehydratase [Streptomyces sp. NBC_01242]WSP61015.1 5-dehydro-4-deoxyglucarate dehydratase [Streptomyces sp. NBC_01240]
MNTVKCDERTTRLSGLLSFPLTPFDDADEVDLDVFASHVEAQIAAGPSGLFVACGTGEFPALGLDEYRQVVATAVKQVAGRIPVFAGAGGGPRVARKFALAAQECGVDGLLLLPPYLLTSTPQGLVHHIRYVAAATPLPITVYQRANAVLDPAAAVELLDIPNVVGIKDGRGDVDAMLRLVTAVRTSGHPRAAEFGFLNGLPTAELSARAYAAIGVESYSSAVHCFAPDIATAFHRAVRDDDEEAQRTLLTEFYLPFAALRDRVPGYAVSLVKAGAQLAGLAVGPVRPPLVEATPEHVAQLASIVDRGRTALRRLEESRA